MKNIRRIVEVLELVESDQLHILPRTMLRHHESRETFEHLAAAIEAISNGFPSLYQPATFTGADTIKAHIADLKDNVTGSIRRIALAESSLARIHNDLIAAHNTRQANSISRLTVAAFFSLPLSLAGTILSMQTRLRDLKYLLFDLACIFVIFCVVALVLVSNVTRPTTPGYLYRGWMVARDFFDGISAQWPIFSFLLGLDLPFAIYSMSILPLDGPDSGKAWNPLLVYGIINFVVVVWGVALMAVKKVQEWRKRRNSSTARST
jgi:hypothetical protein